MSIDIERICVVGAGLIGASWAAFYASKGIRVSIFDEDKTAAEAARKRALEHLDALRDLQLIDNNQHERAGESIRAAANLKLAVQDVQLIQESVTEDHEVKKRVIRELDAHADSKTIIASSSSGLLISELQTAARYPQRCLIAHPFNPPHLIPLVELVAGSQTSDAIVAGVKEFFESVGKTPIVLRKEVPGHVANRLQAALWREAVQLVLDGVVSVADVDKALTAGPGVRWALLGAHMNFHLGGGPGGLENFVAHIGEGWSEIWDDLAAWSTIPPDAARQLGSGVRVEADGRSSEEIARWRDEGIVKILKAIEQE